MGIVPDVPDVLQDHPEEEHDLDEESMAIVRGPKGRAVQRMATKDVDALVGIGGTAAPTEAPEDLAPSRPARMSQVGEGEHSMSEQHLDVEVHIRGKDILATRGSKTDSFVRTILIEENLNEHELGKTEVVHDSLDPEYRQPVQLRFRLDDDKHWLRFELCDPGDNADPEAIKVATVMGALELSLQDLAKMVLGDQDSIGDDTPRGTKKSGLATLDLVPLTTLQGKARRGERGRANSMSTPTPEGKEKKSAELGSLVLVPEIISADEQVCWLVIGANSLRTENLSLPPNPFLKIFRTLADGTKAPVYETGHVRGVRDCAWKTVPIPLQRLHNGDPLRIIVLEVWDWGDVAGSRLFGYAKVPASQLLQGAEHAAAHDLAEESVGRGQKCAQNIPLERPSLKDRRGSLTSTIIGFGRASSPGSLTILRAEIDYDEATAMQVFKTFDVEGVRREAHNLAPPQWMSLSMRYDRVQEERQLGLHNTQINCFTGCARRSRRFEQWLETTDVRRVLKKYNPINATARPSLFYFGGYEPVYYNDDGTVRYQMDVAYFLTAMMATFGISLLWLVLSIGAMLRARRSTASSSGDQSVGEIVELVFNGWDMLETTKRATNVMREHIATHLKQQLLQQNLVANKRQVKSKAQLRDLFIRRVIFIALSVLVLIGSTACVVAVLVPDIRDELLEIVGDNVFGDFLPSIIITSVNMIAPVFIKIFVRLERWEPETELQQAIGRTFVIKMLNLILTAIQLENAVDLATALSLGTGESDYMGSCQESTAGVTYVQLVVTDMVIVALSTSIPKFLIWKIKCKPLGYKTIVDLPKEVMELIYRQALLWVAAMYVPLIYPIGVVAHTVIYFVKYYSFIYLYKAPEKPFSRTSLTSLFLGTSMASLIAMVVPFGYAIMQAANPFCGPLRAHACAALPYNESGACGTSRSNYESLYDSLMEGSVDVFDATNYGNSSIIDQLASCSFSCWVASVINALVSSVFLLVVGILLCIILNFTRARMRQLAGELKRAEALLQEEHHDKIKLLRFNGVQL